MMRTTPTVIATSQAMAPLVPYLTQDGEGQSQSPHGSMMQRWAEVGKPSADAPVLGAAY